MRVIDLFSGCGGMSLGFQNAGFQIVAAYDNWQPAIDIYQRNFQHPIFKKDLSTENIIPELKELHPDMIIGGPPCQDFSIAGKRNFRGKHANLTLKFGEIISEVLPQWFVMENVYNIEKSPIFEEVLTIFKSSGYGITKHVWDASYMGVPQMRRRYFIIGKLHETNDFLLDILLSRISKERMTVRKYFKDKPLDTEYIYQHPRTYKRRAIFSVDEPLSTIRSVNRPIPSNYTIHPADKTSNLSKVRVLTTKERSYIQSFPESFEFVGATSAIEQAIGNAVPVKMAEYISRSINIFLLNENERIKLRPWRESDAEALFTLASDPDVGSRAGWPPHKSVEESREIINTIFHNDSTWAIVLKDDGKGDEPIGAIGYGPSCDCNLPAREDEPLIGYWVGKPYWNQGICTEALRLMLEHIAKTTNIPSLISGHFIDNPASGRVMEKCGFIPTGETCIDPNQYQGDNRPIRVLRLEIKR